ncbi:DUF5050 domain-containing protein [Niallia sp.]|uniref:DUF5050 domain-containing protein n=1 Tax=Niallia sp. TaxID=2837523 RepID=UPI002897A786|nr:DUF5050 domain-containing protein [Niallia sp.]
MKKALIVTLSLFLFGCASVNEEKISETTKDEKVQNQVLEINEQQSSNNESKQISSYENMGNTSGNIQNGGIAAEYKDLVFYSDSERLLVSQKEEVSDLEVNGKVLDHIENEGIIDSINVINDRVYYIKNEVVYKMDVDGKSKEELPIPYPVSKIIVYKDQILFTSYDYEENLDTLYTINTNGEGLKEIAMGIQTFYVNEGKLYWSSKVKDNDYRLYIDDLKSDSEPEVKSHYNLSFFQVDGDVLYYHNADDYYKMNINGIGEDKRNLTAVTKENGSTIEFTNISDDTIFYTENRKMYAMDMIGSKRWEVPTSPVSAYSLAGGHLFYWGVSQGELSLAIYKDVSQAYDIAINERNNSMENTDLWSDTPEELYNLYNELVSTKETITIQELEEREQMILGGDMIFPQDHLIGATKMLLMGFSIRDEHFLKSLLADPVDELTYFDEPLSELPIDGAPMGGYYDFTISVYSEDTVYIERTTSGHDMNVYVAFKKIDDKYYFDDFQ